MLDDLDRRLVEMLARDGRRSFASLADELGVSQSTVRTRLSKLREDDVLQIVALCNALLLGHQVVRLLLRVRNLTPRSVANGLLGISQINHVALVAGSHEIRRHPGVASIQPIIVTSLAKDYTWEGLRGTAGQSISDPDG
jgi:DNA-binding Lrp family transcriptional regulator